MYLTIQKLHNISAKVGSFKNGVFTKTPLADLTKPGFYFVVQYGRAVHRAYVGEQMSKSKPGYRSVINRVKNGGTNHTVWLKSFDSTMSVMYVPIENMKYIVLQQSPAKCKTELAINSMNNLHVLNYRLGQMFKFHYQA